MYRILLVDDEWLELDTLEKYIPWEEMGFQVAGTAENGKEALQLLERLEGSENEEENDRKLPDVVLTDVKMPVMDGLAFSKIPVSYTHLDVYKRQNTSRSLCRVGSPPVTQTPVKIPFRLRRTLKTSSSSKTGRLLP